MKYCKKLLSVLLSLVLCGSMVAPAFAASFADLQEAISGTLSTDTPSGDSSDNHENGSVFTAENGQQRQGYAWNGEANNNQGGWGIEAWDNEGTRHVQLNENVMRTDPADPSEAPTAPITVSGEVVIDTQDKIINGENESASSIFQVSGTLTVNGGTIQGGNNIYGNGGAINAESGAIVTLNNTNVTGNTAAVNGDGIYAEVGATVNLTGTTRVSGNGTEDSNEDIYLAHNDDGEGATLDGSGLSAPSDTVWTEEIDSATTTTSVKEKVTSEEGPRSLTWTDPPKNENSGSGGDVFDSSEVEIADPNVPMSQGPVTCAEFIYKLWLLDGEPAPLDDRGLPATVGEDHEFAEAIAWAVSADVVSVETFDPEELLTVGLAREFLTNFAAYADMVMPELTTLIGEDDDLVLNADDALAEFFGRELDV